MKVVLNGTFDDNGPDGVVYIMCEPAYELYLTKRKELNEFSKGKWEEFHAGNLDVGAVRLMISARKKMLKEYMERNSFIVDDWERF